MKHAIVVGGSSGLGEAIARALRGDGYVVSNLSRRPAPEGAADATFTCDVTEDASVASAVSAALDARGAPEVLVYAAGMPAMGRTLDVPVAEARLAFEVNLWGLDRVVRKAMGPMERRGGGTLLYVSSLAALRAIPHETYYAASKAAAARYLQCLALEAGKAHVEVKLLHVGFVPTGFFARNGWHGMAVPEVNGSGVTPDDVARAALDLLASKSPNAIVGWRENLIARADRLVPNLYDRFLARRMRK